MKRPAVPEAVLNRGTGAPPVHFRQRRMGGAPMPRVWNPALLLPLLCWCTAGCASHPPTPRPVDHPETAAIEYWARQPAVVSVEADDFTPLWRACRRATVASSFTIDRADFRGGVMTTLPLVSKQFFELWRHDVVTPYDLAQSSLDTMRRTVRFDIRRRDDGRYEAAPKVVTERFSLAERRITSVARFAETFSTERVEGDRNRDRAGADLPDQYWSATGRDYALERHLVEAVRNDLRG